MPLWIDKYRPVEIKKLDINTPQRTTIETMLKNSKCNIPHLLMYGPSGSGKKTRVMAIHSMEKRKKSGQKLKKFFFGFLRSKPSKRKMTFFSVFDLKNQANFCLSFCPIFFELGKVKVIFSIFILSMAGP